MRKLYETVILIGFLTFFLGGILCVFTQLAGILIGNPELILQASKITKVIFPVASTSGLLCFLYGYFFHTKKGKSAE